MDFMKTDGCRQSHRRVNSGVRSFRCQLRSKIVHTPQVHANSISDPHWPAEKFFYESPLLHQHPKADSSLSAFLFAGSRMPHFRQNRSENREMLRCEKNTAFCISRTAKPLPMELDGNRHPEPDVI